MKQLSFSKGLVILGAACMTAVSALATPTPPPVTLTVDPNLPPGTTPYVLGSIDPNTPASDAADAAYINGILGLALGGSGTSGGDAIYRSMNVFSGLPTAGTVSGTGAADGTSVTITLTTGFEFLHAKYGVYGEVWFVGNLPVGTVITIPQNAFGNNDDQYGLSGTVLLQGTPGPSTPDGGSTMVLLGLAGLGLYGFVRKTRLA